MGKMPEISPHYEEKYNRNGKQHPEQGPVFFCHLVWVSWVEINHVFPLVSFEGNRRTDLSKWTLCTAVKFCLGAFLEGGSQKF